MDTKRTKNFNYKLLIAASIRGDTAEVQRQRFLAMSNPKHCGSEALQWGLQLALRVASSNRHTECIDLLVDLSDPQGALHYLKTDYPDRPEKYHYLEHKIAERQRAILSSEMNDVADKPTLSARKI